jgi:hypothetical protein
MTNSIGNGLLPNAQKRNGDDFGRKWCVACPALTLAVLTSIDPPSTMVRAEDSSEDSRSTSS